MRVIDEEMMVHKKRNDNNAVSTNSDEGTGFKTLNHDLYKEIRSAQVQ